MHDVLESSIVTRWLTNTVEHAGVRLSWNGTSFLCSSRSTRLIHGPLGSDFQVDIATPLREGEREGHGAGASSLGL